MSDKSQQPLPFVYQFAAGAVAGVSEVCISLSIGITLLSMSALECRVIDPRKITSN